MHVCILVLTFIAGYVTLPRKLTTRGPIDWSIMTDRPPIYDGVGPRTSALGNSGGLSNSNISSSTSEVKSVASSSMASNTISSQKRTSSLKRFPDTSRDSSASEVTIGEDSLTAYIEPFGRALPPLITCRPDSIASATDSDLEAILSREDTGDKRGSRGNASAGGGSSATANSKATSCPLHKSSAGPKIIAIPKDTSKPVVQLTKGPKQLKGILKPSKNITTNPVECLLPPPPPPTMKAPPSLGVVNHLRHRESSSSTSTSSGGSPPSLETNDLINDLSGVHISSKPKPPMRTSSSMNSKNVSEALHV